MAKIERLKSGNYRIRVFLGKDENGKKHMKSFTHEDKNALKLIAAQYENSIKKEKIKYKDKTVEEAISDYIKIKEKVLSPSTVAGYKTIKKNYLKNLMKMKLSAITQQDIQKEINREYVNGKSEKTLKNAHGLLSATLKYNKIDLTLNTTFPKSIKTKIRIPTKEEITKIMKYYENTEMELPFALSVFLGLRRSELCALQWEDFDLKNKTVTISKAKIKNYEKEYVIKQPKTEAGNRTIVIPDACLKMLIKHKKATGNITNINSTALYKRLMRTLDKLQIEHFRWHDLRHYTASIMLALNIPEKYAMEIMGHETNNMLHKVYQHTIKEEMKKISNKINDYFNEVDTKVDTK